jgi:hypothetical protein
LKFRVQTFLTIDVGPLTIVWPVSCSAVPNPPKLATDEAVFLLEVFVAPTMAVIEAEAAAGPVVGTKEKSVA